MQPLLTVQDLRIDFTTESGTVHAVRGVSFELYAGETLALVGESGCGKSVLCKSILGILHRRGRISGGSIHYSGQCLSAMPEKALSQVRGSEIGMVFQNPTTVLDPTMTIGAQVAEAVGAHRKCSRKERMAKALELLKLVGIPQPELRMRQYPHEFSGGMLQRAVIAIALAGEPKILIADEPTTALDTTIQAQILELLSSLQKRTGIAILFITHDLSVVAQIADRVAVMYAGKIVESAKTEELFADPRHPYTWGLFAALPCAECIGGASFLLPGAAPDLREPPKGDAFAPRNRYALAIDYEEEPPLFRVTETHSVASWLAHPDAPPVTPPVRVENGRVIVHAE
ncbi:MAG: ABC transporter ATP-binding protein [Oscillospiraceae bacterium]|jgi:oligopeptide transport system ATP-binding protein